MRRPPLLFAQDSTPELISRIYEAAVNPALWQSVLHLIRINCGADQCAMFYYNSVHTHRNIAMAARLSPAARKIYLNNFIELQARQVQYQFALLPEGAVVTDRDIRELAGNNYSSIVGDEYMQSLWPNLQFQAGAILKRSKLASAGISLKNFSSTPQITQKQINFLQDLTLHLMRALDIHQALVNTEESFKKLTGLFNHFQQGVVLLNEQHEIEFINAAAKAILEKSTQLKITNQHLQFDHYLQASPDTTQKQRPQKRKIDNGEQLVCIDEPWGKVKISAFHLREKTMLCQPLIKSSVFHGSYMLLIQDSHHNRNIPFNYLKQAYHITHAEFNLINELINGCNLYDAARQRDVTKETARWQLKSIMQKTHTHSQSELSRLILAFCDN